MATDMEMPTTGTARKPRAGSSAWGLFTLPLRRLFGHYLFSSLTRRILFLNIAALAVMAAGMLYLNQFRDGLIDARVESLMTQGELIAGAIAASAMVETDSIFIDPERLLELQAGESLPPGTGNLDSLEFPINPEQVAPVLRRLISSTRTRARIYDRDANLVLDSRHLYSRGQVLRYGLPPITQEEPSLRQRIGKVLAGLLRRSDLPVYREQPGGSGASFPEVMNALSGGPSYIVRISEQGEQIVSVAVPIQRYRAVLGALALSTQGGDIDMIVAAERMAILRVFGVAALVTTVLSLLLASTIANPLRRLSAAAVRVRRGGAKNREEIPDFSHRQDEIGNLSVALRDMTNALYARIEAIESFAADVSHELKNPLTSLRSAVETLPLARNENARERLLEVIQHDVRRLDRLITDISDASRLDAELVREDAEKVDLKQLLDEIVSAARNPGRHKKQVAVELHESGRAPSAGYIVLGHDLRLGQVFTNLIENARSFVPEEGGRIAVTIARAGAKMVITVEDNGSGIRVENIDRIFERFYTDRPAGEAFGQNSGLGLSISRQIVEAHGGRIFAENVAGTKPGEIRGARFAVVLPAGD